MVLTLVTDVAQAYLELRELDLELEIALRTRDSFQQTFDLFERQLRRRRRHPARDVARGGGAREHGGHDSRSRAPDRGEGEPALRILLGRPPGEIPRGESLIEQENSPEIPAGLPAALLERRPDVLRAEQNVVAANAQVGVAIGNFLPRIGLSALYGGQSTEIENIVKKSGNVWSIGAAVTGPLFQGGRLYYGYKFDVAAWEEAVLAYEQTVLNALAEVSNTLVARQKFVEANVELERQVVALQDAVSLSNSRYHGRSRELLRGARIAAGAVPRREHAGAQPPERGCSASLQLYRALGGGWQAEEAAHPEQYPRPREALDVLVPQEGARAHP